jgi:hypothetical protein
MKKLELILCFLVALFFIACQQSEVDKQLSYMEQLMEENSNQVAPLLNEINLEDLDSPERRARYALLEQEVHYEETKRVDDSIIAGLYDYYFMHQQKSQYLKASILKSYSYYQHEAFDSSLLYLKEIEPREVELETGYWHEFYKWLRGQIFQKSGQPDLAHEQFYQELQIAKQSGNEELKANALQHYATSWYYNTDKKDSARYYLEQAHSMNLSDFALRKRILIVGNLARVYMLYFPEELSRVEQMLTEMPRDTSDLVYFEDILWVQYYYLSGEISKADSLANIVQRNCTSPKRIKTLNRYRLNYYEQISADSTVLFSSRYKAIMDKESESAPLLVSKIVHIDDEYTYADKHRKIKWALYCLIGILIVVGAIVVWRNRKYKKLHNTLITERELHAETTQREAKLKELLEFQNGAEDINLLLLECATRLNGEPLIDQLQGRYCEQLKKEERTHIVASLQELFAPALRWLQKTYPELTETDEMYCILSYLHADKAACAVLLESSPEALKQRKLRIRKKITEPTLFDLFFPARAKGRKEVTE